MTSQEYIIYGLNNLVDKFPTLTFKYKYNKTLETHIVAVEPVMEFEENKEYLKGESDFVYNFENIYLPETILFISENSLIEVNEADMTFKTNQLGFFVKEDLFQPKYKYNMDLEKIEISTIDFALAA